MDGTVQETEGDEERMKKILRICMKACCVGGMICILANLLVVRSAASRIVWPNALSDRRVDCIIVPGARVYEDGTLCTELQDRMDTAIGLYEAGVSDRLLLSGDHGTAGYDEVTAMKVYAVEKGVQEKDIFLDHAGFSTYETMYRAAAVFGAKSSVVVTQGFHLQRAVYLANKMNMDAYGVKADRCAYPRIGYYEAREALARVKDVAFAAFRPCPTYLGEPICLRGDGRVTACAPFALPILAER